MTDYSVEHYEEDSFKESYKNAGLFLGALTSKLGFGDLAMEFRGDNAVFYWTSKVRGEPRYVERFIRLIDLGLPKFSIDSWASGVARSMKDSMLHSQVKQELYRV